MVPALVIILGFQLTGEVVSRGLALTVPGPVLGMVALVLACALRPRLADLLRPVTQVLLSHLSLLFVPAGVGVIAHLDKLREYGLGVAVAIAVSTLLAIAAGAWAFVLVARWTGRTEDD